DLCTRRSLKMSGADGGAMALSPEGRLVAAMTYHDASLYDVRTGRRLKILQLAESTSNGTYPMAPIAFSPDSKQLIVQSSDSDQLEVWDVRRARRLRVLPKISGAVFWVEPRVLLVCSRDGVQRVPLT
ncbi:WD40 repeat domain-containing protein, partial [Xanthomonas citri pv. citri]